MENNTSKRPRKTHKRKKEQRGSGVVGLAASVLAHVAIEVIVTINIRGAATLYKILLSWFIV